MQIPRQVRSSKTSSSRRIYPGRVYKCQKPSPTPAPTAMDGTHKNLLDVECEPQTLCGNDDVPISDTIRCYYKHFSVRREQLEVTVNILSSPNSVPIRRTVAISRGLLNVNTVDREVVILPVE